MVLPKHKGAAVEGRWSGPDNRARVRSPADREYFSRIFAWLDDGRDETVKSSYRFIHHFVSEDGEPGAASIEACRTGIAVLNGARGGTVLTGDDREGVYEHLAYHLEQAGIEPPELRSAEAASLLYRSVAGRTLEVRIGLEAARIERRSGGRPMLAGYAAVYDQPSVDFGGWREIIARSAFDDALANLPKQPVKALWNHNADWVLGSTDSGTLRLRSDETGLYCEIAPPENAIVQAFVDSVRRGDVTQMSLGFLVREQDWKTVDGELLRVLHAVELWEVSPVAFPAYPQTSIVQRADPRLQIYERLLRLEEVKHVPGKTQ